VTSCCRSTAQTRFAPAACACSRRSTRRFQRLARQAIKDTLYERNDPAAALVSINPANGAIRAMTAVTPGRTGNQFKPRCAGTPPAGSTFKTFVLTTAIATASIRLDLLRVGSVPTISRIRTRRRGT